MPLVKTPKFNIGDRVNVEFFNGSNSYEGTIIDIFKKFEVPDKEKVIKYYGDISTKPKFGKIFGPLYEDRIIIKKDIEEESFSIFPIAGYGRFFIITKIEKPPIGLIPKGIHKDIRINDICKAIERYSSKKLRIPIEWIEEYNELITKGD